MAVIIKMTPSGMWHRVIRYKLTDCSEERAASIFKVE
jgi:hypothetical protein